MGSSDDGACTATTHGISKLTSLFQVGGRKIGMGSGNNKKEAQLRTYLDVTVSAVYMRSLSLAQIIFPTDISRIL